MIFSLSPETGRTGRLAGRVVRLPESPGHSRGQYLLNQTATFSPGFGGDGTTGNGGLATAVPVSKISVPIADYTSFF